jgi:hypothetical protein
MTIEPSFKGAPFSQYPQLGWMFRPKSLVYSGMGHSPFLGGQSRFFSAFLIIPNYTGKIYVFFENSVKIVQEMTGRVLSQYRSK